MRRYNPLSVHAGFTIVELLIVIVVIGVLAAIVIVAYNGIQNRANDTAIQSDFANAAKKIESQKILGTTGVYGPAPYASTVGSSFSKNAYSTASGVNNVIYCTALDGSEYGLAALSKSGKRYYVTNAKQVTEYAWTWTNSGASTCPNILQNNITTGTYTWSWGYTNGTWQF